MRTLRSLPVSPLVLGTLFITLATLVMVSSILESRRGKAERQEVMAALSSVLLESLAGATESMVLANEELESQLRENLLAKAEVVRTLYESGLATSTLLKRMAGNDGRLRICIQRPGGQRHAVSHDVTIAETQPGHKPPNVDAIFSGEADTLVLGLSGSHFDDVYRYGVALATRDRSAVIVHLEAEELVAFRERVGFAPLLEPLAGHVGMVYIAVQDSARILAAAGDIEKVGMITPGALLPVGNELPGDTPHYYARRDSIGVIEFAQDFRIDGSAVGLFRLGLSTEPLVAVERLAIRRMVVNGLALFFVGFVILALSLARQNAELLKRQKVREESFSARVLARVDNAILVFNPEGRLVRINTAATRLLKVKEAAARGRLFKELLPGEAFRRFLESPATRDQVEFPLPDGALHLLVSKSGFLDENRAPHTLIVVQDLTRIRELEATVTRKEREQAMGALASGLAHEIRNPLNAVGMIAQQLRNDFRPAEDPETYDQFTRIIVDEVNRISEAVKAFLMHVRPVSPTPESFDIDALLEELGHEYGPGMQQQGIHFDVRAEAGGSVHWDRNQMRQAIMNLVQNAMDAFDSMPDGDGRRIGLECAATDDETVEVSVCDTGPGISPEIRDRVFDLYFTTRAEGTGIGLATVQRIVQDHGGTVRVSGGPGHGTTFRMRIPRWPTADATA